MAGRSAATTFATNQQRRTTANKKRRVMMAGSAGSNGVQASYHGNGCQATGGRQREHCEVLDRALVVPPSGGKCGRGPPKGGTTNNSPARSGRGSQHSFGAGHAGDPRIKLHRGAKGAGGGLENALGNVM